MNNAATNIRVCKTFCRFSFLLAIYLGMDLHEVFVLHQPWPMYSDAISQECLVSLSHLGLYSWDNPAPPPPFPSPEPMLWLDRHLWYLQYYDHRHTSTTTISDFAKTRFITSCSEPHCEVTGRERENENERWDLGSAFIGVDWGQGR